MALASRWKMMTHRGKNSARTPHVFRSVWGMGVELAYLPY